MKISYLLLYVAAVVAQENNGPCKVTLNSDFEFSQCAEDNTRMAFFSYNEDGECDPYHKDSERLPDPLFGLPCSHECEGGSFTTIDFVNGKPELVCQRCEANHIAVAGGFRYDASMDTNSYLDTHSNPNLKHFSTSCLYQNQVTAAQSQDCTSWTPSGSSLIAQHPFLDQGKEVGSATYQFTLTYENDFIAEGEIGFKYRRVQKQLGDQLNGQFYFLADNNYVMEPANYSLGPDWHSIQYTVPKGAHKFQWIYLKTVNDWQGHDLFAEIESIEVIGVKATIDRCDPCSKGVANQKQTKCYKCKENEYLSTGELGDIQGCKACQEGYFSPIGSDSPDQCKPRPKCSMEDIEVKFSNCNSATNKRTKSYEWRKNNVCDKQNLGSFKKPASEEVECRGCGFGQHRNATNHCVNCEIGTYQPVDNHDGGQGKIKECEVCPAGSYAPRVKDYGHFEEIPRQFFQGCSIATSEGDSRDCETNYGWRVNEDQVLDSSGTRGVPRGMKIWLMSRIHFNNPLGGRLKLQYKLSDFSEFEYFQVLINGVTQLIDRKATDDFVVFKSNSIPFGFSTFEISVISNVTLGNQQLHSKARAIIQRLSFVGSHGGGAGQCFKILESKDKSMAYYSTEKSEMPELCPIGQEPNAGRTSCVKCESGSFSPTAESMCKRCPMYTLSSDDRSSCFPAGKITTSEGQIYFPGDLQPTNYCKGVNKGHLCDEGKEVLGPIKFNGGAQMLFFSTKQPLPANEYDYHTSMYSSEVEKSSSYIYMIQEIKNGYLHDFEEFFQHNVTGSMEDPDTKEVTTFSYTTGSAIDHQLMSSLVTKDLKILLSFGTQVEAISNVHSDGYSVVYKDGSFCNRQKGIRFKSVVNFRCNTTEEFGTPLIKKYPEARENQDDCTVVFEWSSKEACQLCTINQLAPPVEGTCQNNMMNVIQKPIKDEPCQIVSLKDHRDEYKAQLKSEYEDLQYVTSPNVMEECDPHTQMAKNELLVALGKMILFMFAVAFIFCCSAACSYSSLSRKYEKLRKWNERYSEWVVRMKQKSNDLESGSLTYKFAQKVQQAEKKRKQLSKGIKTLAKSGPEGIKQAVKKQLKKKQQDREPVAMEEFEVEIGEFD